ncbi:YitT family membrane protein [Ligilactobacillus salitolerans]|uniref:YitT family membrane protein n=1 Tax=Ligilactobacillus salitolerans TaxID=1808352 RepID=A0A401IUV2_9LACO|nr:YitT family protein [Ligilactobacillus salitolerans]GBG95333.1 YitT family membrane protein [Ligilactobacillus salitolerans]
MAEKKSESIRILDLIMIAVGCSIFAFSLVFFNIANNLADGGLSGVTLIIKAVFHFDPAYTTLLLNIPLIWMGYRYLGRQALIYTIYGTIVLSIMLWIWQRVPLSINIDHDLFLASIGAGICGGIGQGIVYRFGGTTGGTDIIARMFERFKGVPMGQTLLWLDVVILTISLVYVDLRHMAYTLLYSYVATRLINSAIDGAYEARGNLIISEHHREIADTIMQEMDRGVTILHAEGAFSNDPRPTLYVAVEPSELHVLKEIVSSIDPTAFMTSFSVNEAAGEGFTYRRPKNRLIKKRSKNK